MFDVDMFVESLLDSLGTGLQGFRGSEQLSTQATLRCARREQIHARTPHCLLQSGLHLGECVFIALSQNIIIRRAHKADTAHSTVTARGPCYYVSSEG